MKTILAAGIALGCALAARADFSYSTTTTMTGGMMGAMAGQKPQLTKHLLKGDKLRMDSGATVTIMDFGAQTFTTISHSTKSYRVMPFGELTKTVGDAKADFQIDVKETGATKMIGDWKARQVIMTMDVDSPQAQGMKMRMTMDMWLSSDVKGADEMKAFYQRNAAKFPWSAMTQGASGKQQAQMAELSKKMANLGGIPLLQVMKMSASGNDPKTADMKSQMASACAKFEEMKKQGGQMAQMAEKYAAQMGCGTNTAAGASNSLMEATTEASGFSTAAIAATAFAIPAGYKQEAK